MKYDVCFTGYGHIYPRTLNGQLFTIGYSLVAMGITLVMLSQVGAALADGLIYTYRLCIVYINFIHFVFIKEEKLFFQPKMFIILIIVGYAVDGFGARGLSQRFHLDR